MKVNFSDYINDSIRILILLNAVKDRKSIKMTDNKIKLYDYYLKFPFTMSNSDLSEPNEPYNFDEYYAFFHWHPDLIRYRQSLNYLIAKEFIVRQIENNAVTYIITDLGVQALEKIKSCYKSKLEHLAQDIVSKLCKLSDTKIEQQIHERSKAYFHSGGIKHEI